MCQFLNKRKKFSPYVGQCFRPFFTLGLDLTGQRLLKRGVPVPSLWKKSPLAAGVPGQPCALRRNGEPHTEHGALESR